VVVRGTTKQGIAVLQIATGTIPITGTTITGFAWRGSPSYSAAKIRQLYGAVVRANKIHRLISWSATGRPNKKRLAKD